MDLQNLEFWDKFWHFLQECNVLCCASAELLSHCYSLVSSIPAIEIHITWTLDTVRRQSRDGSNVKIWQNFVSLYMEHQILFKTAIFCEKQLWVFIAFNFDTNLIVDTPVMDYPGTTLRWTGRLWHFFQNWNHKR